MKAFVLLMWISGYYPGGALSQEFSSQAACENAGKVATEKFRSFVISISYVCVPKEL